MPLALLARQVSAAFKAPPEVQVLPVQQARQEILAQRGPREFKVPQVLLVLPVLPVQTVLMVQLAQLGHKGPSGPQVL